LILVDTGPLVALFDPSDAYHARCVQVLKTIEEPIGTTIPVLTEAFHLLSPGSMGSQRLIDFIADAGLTVWFLDDETLARTFSLMIKYADAPMDLADASLVVTAERLALRKVFTIDRKDFATYRIKRGHKHLAFKVIVV
jgi:predicted nucleic acid-binding protein